MISFSERFKFIFLVSTNGMFIVAGIFMIAYGLYKNLSNPPEAVSLFDNTNGTTNVLAGCIDILIGACGLAGALLRRRMLLMINAGLLIAAILGNFILMIFAGVSGSLAMSRVKHNMELAVVLQYGNSSDPDSRDFTRDIDEYQNLDGCCGWSGSGGRNLFQESPWYKQNMIFGRRLPDSCCARVVEECWATTDLKAAREKGLVNKHDCMDRILGRMKLFLSVTLTQLIIVTLVQIVVAAFSAFIITTGGVTD